MSLHIGLPGAPPAPQHAHAGTSTTYSRAHLCRHRLREGRQPDGGEAQRRNLLGAPRHVVEPAALLLPAVTRRAGRRGGGVGTGTTQKPAV